MQAQQPSTTQRWCGLNTELLTIGTEIMLSSIVRISMLTVREKKPKGGIDYWGPGWREQGREGNKED